MEGAHAQVQELDAERDMVEQIGVMISQAKVRNGDVGGRRV